MQFCCVAHASRTAFRFALWITTDITLKAQFNAFDPLHTCIFHENQDQIESLAHVSEIVCEGPCPRSKCPIIHSQYMESGGSMAAENEMDIYRA